jgi:D-beta-D-heptose 7-phosphate kinase / D-beta-D-heptose 1-phosphate adenosyltransferase
VSRLVVVGDALLDRDLEGRVERLCPDAPAAPVVEDVSERPRPGGAALAAALARMLDGHEVVLVTALAGDDAGQLLARLLDEVGVVVVDLGLAGDTPQKVRVRCEGQTLLRLDRGGRGGTVGPVGSAVGQILEQADGVLMADYGRGVAAQPAMRSALAAVAGRVPVVWDPHPWGSAPVAGVRLATPNRAEVARLAPSRYAAGDPPDQDLGDPGLVAQARALAASWGIEGMAVTLGARGALLLDGGGEVLVPARAVRGSDSCGAGDRFAGSVAGLLAGGASLAVATAGAVRAASAFVAAGGAAGMRLAGEGVVVPHKTPRRRRAASGDGG